MKFYLDKLVSLHYHMTLILQSKLCTRHRMTLLKMITSF